LQNFDSFGGPLNIFQVLKLWVQQYSRR